MFGKTHNAAWQIFKLENTNNELGNISNDPKGYLIWGILLMLPCRYFSQGTRVSLQFFQLGTLVKISLRYEEHYGKTSNVPWRMCEMGNTSTSNVPRQMLYSGTQVMITGRYLSWEIFVMSKTHI